MNRRDAPTVVRQKTADTGLQKCRLSAKTYHLSSKLPGEPCRHEVCGHATSRNTSCAVTICKVLPAQTLKSQRLQQHQQQKEQHHDRWKVVVCRRVLHFISTSCLLTCALLSRADLHAHNNEASTVAWQSRPNSIFFICTIRNNSTNWSKQILKQSWPSILQNPCSRVDLDAGSSWCRLLCNMTGGLGIQLDREKGLEEIDKCQEAKQAEGDDLQVSTVNAVTMPSSAA